MDPVDRPFLERTLLLAGQAGRATAPNPRVGALVARDLDEIGAGWHRRAGEPHAEAIALAQAGRAARGAVLYTSLEPCAHSGRTPPCTDAIIAAGIARVVVGLIDPDPRVAGEGIARLRAAGIAVEVADGDLARDAARVNEDYIVHRRAGRAFAALKVAATLDGRIADRDGASRWITGESARARGRSLRARFGAILVGSGTLLADDPVLLPPVPVPEAPPFFRCVLDPRLTASPAARLFEAVPAGCRAPVLVFTTPDAPEDRAGRLQAAGAEVVRLGPPGGPIPAADLLRELARRDVLGVLVEGGGRTHGTFLRDGLADKIYWFAAPRLLGDTTARAAIDAGPRPLGSISEWQVEMEEHLDRDILLVLYPVTTEGRQTL